MDLAYLVTVGSCAGAAVTLWLSPPRWLNTLCWGAVFASLCVLLSKLGLISSHLPIFGERLEAPLSVAWLLSLLGIIIQFVPGRAHVARFVMIAVTMCVLSTLHVKLEAHPDAFWYSHWTVFGFFFFRVLSISGVLFSGAFYGAALFDIVGSRERATRLWAGRNILLASIVLFGISELSGCIWALRGWGEFWLFNPGFMSSAGSFLVLQVPLHLYGRWKHKPQVLPVVGMLCPVVFLQLVLLRMH